jgi:hypothetical protein
LRRKKSRKFVLDHLRRLAISDGLLDKLVLATNQRLAKQLPELQTRKRALARDGADIDGQIVRLVGELGAFSGTPMPSSRPSWMNWASTATRSTQPSARSTRPYGIQTSALTAEPIREALGHITEIYAQLKPLEQKELFRLVLKRAEVSERKMVLELYGDALLEGVQGESLQAPGRQRFETPDRLPESITQSVVLYEFPVRLRGLRVARRLREQHAATHPRLLVCSI